MESDERDNKLRRISKCSIQKCTDTMTDTRGEVLGSLAHDGGEWDNSDT